MRDYNFDANYASSKDLSSSNYYTGSVQKACTPEISKYDRLMNKLKDNNYKLVVIDTRGSKIAFHLQSKLSKALNQMLGLCSLM